MNASRVGLPSSALLLDQARQVLRAEAAAVAEVASRLDESFVRLVEVLHRCSGCIVVTGVGKSADVGQKLVGTLNSTGTRAVLLDATRAMHGDLGLVHPADVVLMLSHSGESEELIRLLGPIRSLAQAVLVLTGNSHSTLARQAHLALVYGPITETCPLELAPSTSTTVMLALGDAIAFALSRLRRFTTEDFARFHPAGSLGRKLSAVDQYMRTGADLRIATEDRTVREVFAAAGRVGRRTGAIMLTDSTGRLTGIFTDSDLARLFESRADAMLDRPIREVMTTQPRTVRQGTRLLEALQLLQQYKISELPVVDADHRPVGLLDITDLIGLLPAEVKQERQAA